jgi:predicted Zn-ribbon and HTH transcriptional regulator
MSRVKKIIKGLADNPMDIAEGFIRVATGNEHPCASDRMAICDDCEKKEDDPIFGGFMCSECGCHLKEKVNSDAKCPLGKW